MDKKTTEEDNSKETLASPGSPSSSKTTTIVVAILTFLLGLGIGWYLGKNINLSISMEKNIDASNVTPTLIKEDSQTNEENSPTKKDEQTAVVTPTTAPAAVSTYPCSNVSIKIGLQVPSDWSCESKESFLNIKSDLFTISMSNLGRGGPCPMGDDAPECVATYFYTRGTIKIETYTAGPDSKSIFGSLDDSTPEIGITWIEIGYPNMVSRDLTAQEKAELFGVLDSIKKI